MFIWLISAEKHWKVDIQVPIDYWNDVKKLNDPNPAYDWGTCCIYCLSSPEKREDNSKYEPELKSFKSINMLLSFVAGWDQISPLSEPNSVDPWGFNHIFALTHDSFHWFYCEVLILSKTRQLILTEYTPLGLISMTYHCTSNECCVFKPSIFQNLVPKGFAK